MYTRCPGCHAIHPLNAAILARAEGRYRCGKCDKTNNALDALFDEMPNGVEAAAGNGELPVLGASVELDTAARARRDGLSATQQPEDDDIDLLPRSRAAEPVKRVVWVIGLITVSLTIVLLLSEFLGKPLHEQAWVQHLLVTAGLAEEQRQRPFRNLQAIHVVNREMKAHPQVANRLVLNATIVNRAEQKQSYPYVEVKLMNSAGRELSRSRYAPRDYLSSGSDVTAGLSPDAYLPFSIEIDDPGQRAVGFELNFE